jgi:NitT/TauT family transport system substrate-binding protein
MAELGMTRRRILLISTILAIIGLFGLSARSYRPWAQPVPTPFRIAFNTWVGYGPFYIAQQTGIFNRHHLDVELIRLEGTGERRAALLAKRIDALGSTMDDFVVGLSEGVNGEMVAVLDESRGADGIVAKQDITTVSDLRGKRIAVQPGFVNHFFLLYELQKAGIGPTDFQLVPLEPDTAFAALEAGEVDAAVTWEPHLSAVKGQTKFHVVMDTSYPQAQHIIFDNLLVRTDIGASRRNDVIELLKSWYEALDYMKRNQESTNKILGKVFDLPPQEIPKVLTGVWFPNWKQNISFMDDRPETGSGALAIAQKVVELYTTVGVIRTPLSNDIVKQHIASVFLRQAFPE